MSTSAEPEAGALLERYALKAFVEACLILEDGVASARDIDFGMAAGAGGTPPWPPPPTRRDWTRW